MVLAKTSLSFHPTQFLYMFLSLLYTDILKIETNQLFAQLFTTDRHNRNRSHGRNQDQHDQDRHNRDRHNRDQHNQDRIQQPEGRHAEQGRCG